MKLWFWISEAKEGNRERWTCSEANNSLVFLYKSECSDVSGKWIDQKHPDSCVLEENVDTVWTAALLNFIGQEQSSCQSEKVVQQFVHSGGLKQKRDIF